MNKNLENLIICPNCLNTLDINNTYCKNCNYRYEYNFDIFDLRLIDNRTKGFNINRDKKISKVLIDNYDKFRYFNGLYNFFEVLASLKNVNNINFDQLYKKFNLKNKDTPLTPSQSIHGYDILDKINLYLEDINYKPYQYNVCLENGCGLGFFVEGFSRKFSQILVVDFSLSYLVLTKKITNEKKINNCLFICASVENLPIKNNSIDLIHSNNVIEHISDQAKMVSEMSRVVNNSGYAFILSPNKFSVYIEPHFGFPFYGFVPKIIRKWIVYKTKNIDCDIVSLISLRQLKKILKENFLGQFHISFLPSSIKKSAQGGKIRSIIIYCLNNKLIGLFFNLLINKILISLMPYHVVIAKKKLD
tara:strand:+ start:5138 stop:6220 length:1083 start_codon:yes stop_codon:yes gene_type:complete